MPSEDAEEQLEYLRAQLHWLIKRLKKADHRALQLEAELTRLRKARRRRRRKRSARR